jgi:ABC-type transporter Mla subunit MlaD
MSETNKTLSDLMDELSSALTDLSDKMGSLSHVLENNNLAHKESDTSYSLYTQQDDSKPLNH